MPDRDLNGEGWRARWQRWRQHLGTWPALAYGVHKGLQAISGNRAALVVYGVYAQPLTGQVPAGLRSDPRWQLTEARAGDPITSAFPRPARVLQQRWEDGSRCFVLTKEERFAGHIWVQTELHEEDEIRCDYVLPPDAAAVWDYDVYLTPEQRLGRAMQRLWTLVDLALSSEGCRWSFSRISLFNPGSIRSHERLGAVRTALVLALVFPRVQVLMCSRMPWIHLSWAPTMRPRLKLRVPERR